MMRWYGPLPTFPPVRYDRYAPPVVAPPTPFDDLAGQRYCRVGGHFVPDAAFGVRKNRQMTACRDCLANVRKGLP